MSRETDILDKIDKLENMQKEIDQKTKDASAYKDMNSKLRGLMHKMIVAFICVILISSAVCIYCVHTLYTFESNVDTEVTSETFPTAWNSVQYI